MFKNNRKQLQKLVLSAFFISFSIVLSYYTKFLISGFSLKNSFLTFSSILLGAKYGAIIRHAEDILFNLFFNSMGCFWFDLNIIYAIEGAFPALCLLLLNYIDKNKKFRFIFLSLIIFLIEFLSFLLSFYLIDNDIKKITIPFFEISFKISRVFVFKILTCFIIIFYVFLITINILFFLIKKNKKQSTSNVYNIDINGIAIAVILTIIIFELLIFSFIRSIHQEISFKICLVNRLNFTIKHLFLDTIFVIIFLIIAKKNKKINYLFLLSDNHF